MTDAPTSPLVVVGVDGSPAAEVALDIAIEEARLRHARLHVTYAYAALGAPLTGSTGHDYYEQTEHEAHEVLERAAAAGDSDAGEVGEAGGVRGDSRPEIDVAECVGVAWADAALHLLLRGVRCTRCRRSARCWVREVSRCVGGVSVSSFSAMSSIPAG